MNSQINELIKMGDRESLFEVMTEDEDWMTQFDAAEGLVKLGDRRGYEFLLTATLSDDDEILDVANEIFNSPELAKMRREIETEREGDHRLRVESAKKRLGQGGKVFRYKMVYLASSALMGNDPLGKGFEIPALGDHGLEGWEIVHILPARRALLVGSVDDHFTGAYFLLKKEVLPSESAELDNR
jgi:HEAT repeat protein